MPSARVFGPWPEHSNPAASCLQWSCALQAEAVDTFFFFACAHLTRGRCCTSDLIAPPFIFTEVQIRQLLEQAARLPPSDSLRPWTYCTLFSLLAVTGLRISEALAPRFEDITADGLMIRTTKFHKHRLVPLHPSAQAGLERYLERRRQLGGGGDHRFIWM